MSPLYSETAHTDSVTAPNNILLVISYLTMNLNSYNKLFKCFWLSNLLLLGLAATTAVCQTFPAAKISEDQFRKPTESINRPLTWWHWINGNVTKDGIRKDLIDMKRVGIAGVQLFDTHMYLPKGPVRYGSDKWYDYVNYAIRTCDSLGLEFYITNSPGWSGAGGPWIPIEKSMKQLVYSEIYVPGNQAVAIALPQPYTKKRFYKDIAVLALPAEDDEAYNIGSQLLKLSSDGTLPNIQNLYDQNYQSSTIYPAIKGEKPSIQFEFKNAVTANLLNIDLSCTESKVNIAGTVEASLDGINYSELTKINYVHEALSGNFSIPFKKSSLKYLRIRFAGVNSEGAVRFNEISIKNLRGVENWEDKIALSKAPLPTMQFVKVNNKSSLTTGQVIDVTKFYDPVSGTLKWNAPTGKWVVIRFGYTSTGATIHPAVPEGSGYEVDKLDPEAVAFQFNQSLGRLIKESKKYINKTFKGILFDSFEGGYQNWTDKIPEMFANEKGYELISFLPVFTGRTVNSTAESYGVLYDFQDLLINSISQNYFGTMQKLAHQNNLVTFVEAYGGMVSTAQSSVYADIPMFEFWTHSKDFINSIRPTASIANILGKNVIAGEAFTSKPEFGKWQNTPYQLKKNGDYAFTSGINRYVFHTYTHQPFDLYPGFTMGRYGTHFGRTNTWWKYAPDWINYITRSQHLLQKGRTVSDICYLSAATAIYEEAPKLPAFPYGYNYDVFYPQFLKDLNYKNGRLVLSTGPQYHLLVLPEHPYMSYATLKEVYRLLLAGAHISGPPPIAPPDLKGSQTELKEFNNMVNLIWGSLDGKVSKKKSVGRGTIYWGIEIVEILEGNKVDPDFYVPAAQSKSLRYIHRKVDDSHIYFVSNQSEEAVSTTVTLRVGNKQPEYWDAKTGETAASEVFQTDSTSVSVPVMIGPYGSVFVVLQNPLPKKWTTFIGDLTTVAKKELIPVDITLANGKLLYSSKTGLVSIHNSEGKSTSLKLTPASSAKIIGGAWDVKFTDGRGAPATGQKMPELRSWTDYSDRNIRHYSGSAVYGNTFSLSSAEVVNKKALLDLGEVFDMAEVSINGKLVGASWMKPAVLDISPFLRSGKNDIKITVVNRWINRLIGDEAITTPYKYESGTSVFTTGRILEWPDWLYDSSRSRTDKRVTFATWRHYKDGDPLTKSGLIGPVKIFFYNELKLK